jgi:DNA-binding SARP family transcriptional activator/pimeloyl-ACP methyl ester carboxylesterase
MNPPSVSAAIAAGESEHTPRASRQGCVLLAPSLQEGKHTVRSVAVAIVRVLGRIEVDVDGQARPIGSPKQRLLIAVLAAARGPVSRNRLIDALWGDEPPSSATATLMGYVSRLRATLGRESIASNPEGYELKADSIDARQFESLIGERPPNEAGNLERALALWHGEAFGEFSAHPFLLGAARRLHELRTHTRIQLATAYMHEGDTARPISMLEALVADEPSREDAWVALVRALLAAGRLADATSAAHRCRRALTGIGLEPSSSLIEVEGEALQQRSEAAPLHPSVGVDIGPVRYARNGEVHLAYQIVGGGSVDLILSSYGSVSIDSIWDCEQFSAFINQLAASCRVVLYDTRGIGLSDPINVDSPPSLEQQADDLRCVVEASNATRAVIVGIGEGGPVAIAFAPRHPGLLAGLVLINTFARLIKANDYPVGITQERFDANLHMSVDPNSDRDTSLVLRNHAPSVAGDPDFRLWWERAGRRGASPATAAALWRVRYGADVRDHLDALDAPALVLHRRHNHVIPMVHGAYLAQRLRRARFVEIEGSDQTPFTEGADAIAAIVIDFVTALTHT